MIMASKETFTYPSLARIRRESKRFQSDSRFPQDGVLRVPDGTRVILDFAYRRRANIRRLVIPEGVTEIGVSAFQYCENLETVSLPGTLRIIGWYAFEGCHSLRGIAVPEGVAKIGGSAFQYCKNLETVSLPGTLRKIGWHA